MRFLFAVCLSLSATGYGQGTGGQLMEHRIDSLLSAKFTNETPGVAVLVARNGAIIYEKAFGNASLELHTPLTPSMLFDIGSITKQFTAVAILQLVEKGKISLDDSIQQYIPDFPFKGYKITIENLLTHTSGIPDYMQLHPSDVYLERRDFTHRDVIDSVKNRPLEFEPGTQFRYSNSGYFLLGYIIARVSGEPYYEYLQKHLFSPAGLRHTYYNLPGEVIPGHVYGYKNETGHFEKADFWSATLPFAAGGLVSDVEDLYKWQSALNSGKLLHAKFLEKALTSFVLKDGTVTGYGYGWYIRGSGITSMISHGGAITGFRSSVDYFPGQGIFIAVLGNCDCINADALAVSVSDMVLGKALQPDIDLPDSVLNRYLGSYFMQEDPKKIIVIQKSGAHLVADLKGQGVFQLLFSTDSTFELKDVMDAQCEFKIRSGKATGFVAHQHGDHVWTKKDQ